MGGQPRVVQPRCDGENHGGPKREGTKRDHPGCLRQLVQNDDGHRQHLGQGIDLAEDTRLKITSAYDGIENCRYKQDAYIAPEDEDSDPNGH